LHLDLHADEKHTAILCLIFLKYLWKTLHVTITITAIFLGGEIDTGTFKATFSEGLGRSSFKVQFSVQRAIVLEIQEKIDAPASTATSSGGARSLGLS